MLKNFRFVLLPVLVATAIVVAGCGGSSTPSGGAGSAGTTGTTGSGTNPSHAGLTATSSVSSPAAIKFLVQEGEKGGLTASQSQAYISCFEKKLSARGITTFAQFHAKLATLISSRDSCITLAKKS